MHHEFTAVIEQDGEWFVSYCREIPGANGQGRTKEESLESLSAAVKLILRRPTREHPSALNGSLYFKTPLDQLSRRTGTTSNPATAYARGT